MGEDIAEMGGSMGVTQGMLDEFGPERVRNTPISEMAIVGTGIGAAMQGMRPIVEIMYEDFLTLSLEQIVNQAAKHRYMSGGQVKVPLVIRTQGGAGWSPGAQHAQQLEAWFCHIPGLKVVFASTPTDVRGLLWTSIYDDNPIVFFEHRTLYGLKEEVPDEIEPIELGKARVHREGEDVTVVATGRLVHESLAAAKEAEEQGISVEVVDPRTLQPLDEGTIVDSVKKTNRCVVAHEAVTRMGLRRRGGRGRPAPGVRLARRADRARGREVRADAVRAGDGGVRRPARRRRSRRDPDERWAAPMATEVKLPRLGQGMESGTIVKWLKSEGDQVEKGEPLYELDTEKVTQEVEADASRRAPEDRRAGGRGRGRAGRSPSSARRARRSLPRRAAVGRRRRGRGRARGRGGTGRRGAGGGGLARARARRGAAARPRCVDAGDETASGASRRAASTAASRPRRWRAGSRASAASTCGAIQGTGPDGRIVAEDVERAAATPAPAAAPRRPTDGRARDR